MSLRDIQWKIRYRSSDDDLLRDFYLPALSKAVLYQRAAGYFSTGSLVVAARGIVNLIKNSGKMQLVVSPNFSEEDILAIEKGYDAKENIISAALSRNFIYEENDFFRKRLEIVSWLISHGHLEIKVAIPQREGKISRGIYHEKVGIFLDKNNDYISFSGSINESQAGYVYNFESFDVQCSWSPGLSAELASIKINEFRDLWKGGTKNLEIVDVPKAIKDKLISFLPDKEPEFDPEDINKNGEIVKVDRNVPKIPFQLRPHQIKAWDQWLANKCRGVLQHATGAGKTITGLSIAVNSYNKLKKLAVVILCPQKHLVDQWAKDAINFGFNPILGYEDSKDWYGILSNAISDYNLGISDKVAFITTNTSFSMEKAQGILRSLKGPTLIIADEVHNLGARHLRKGLIETFDLRLGLSATPDRWYDEIGTKAIYDYFGKLIEPTYTITDAINDGYLCKYLYFPYLVELTHDEFTEYQEISLKLSQLFQMGKVDSFENSSEDYLQQLLFKRARIISAASNKIKVLKDLSPKYKDENYTIFYCGDGSAGDEKQISTVCNLLGVKLGMKISTFTAKEDGPKRREILDSFKNKELQALVAIRCLDEGTDVPDVRRAFILSSSTNPRQFIQRRGRVLRMPAWDKTKIAEIYDFIVVPPDIQKQPKNIFNIERELIKKELVRLSEFASTAFNGPEARLKIQELAQKYNLMDII